MSGKRVLLLLLAATIAAACTKTPEAEFDSATAIGLKVSTLPAEGGSTFVSVTAKYEWTLSVEFEGGASAWASVEPSSGTGSKGDVRLRFESNEGEESRSLTLVLVPKNGVTVRKTVQQAGEGGSVNPGGGQYGFDVAPMDWLELPATVAGDGLEVLVHAMDGGKYVSKAQSGVRNWSCYWDYSEHLSLWVAYPLNNSLKGSGSRSNAWGYDPLLPTSIQPNISNGSYGGGWTRGHQLPSADRLATYAANASTFVPTNMTPQDYDFNGEIWGNLEGRVRSYAAVSDTLYVVTGCLYKNSTRTSGTSSGFAVKIPTHYFKALLFRGTSTYATRGFMAAAYLLPHDKSIHDGDFLDYIMSVDELEQTTGIDFFPHLADYVGKESADAIEAAAPSKWWK